MSLRPYSVFTPHSYHDAGARIAADSAKSKAVSVQREIGLLRGEIERLMMITEALWVILKEELNYDDAALIERIRQIDLRDGKLDGRVSTKTRPQQCAKCNRPVSKRRPVCPYCGAPVAKLPFER